jgi:hypothetical protein
MVFFVTRARHFAGFLCKAEWIYRHYTYFIINALCALYRMPLFHEHTCHRMTNGEVNISHENTTMVVFPDHELPTARYLMPMNHEVIHDRKC